MILHETLDDQACYQWEGEDLLLKVRVQPRASKDEIIGIQNNQLKIRLTAPPVDGEANKHLICFLSKIFKVAKSRIRLISGQSGQEKRPAHLIPLPTAPHNQATHLIRLIFFNINQLLKYYLS